MPDKEREKKRENRNKNKEEKVKHKKKNNRQTQKQGRRVQKISSSVHFNKKQMNKHPPLPESCSSPSLFGSPWSQPPCLRLEWLAWTEEAWGVLWEEQLQVEALACLMIKRGLWANIHCEVHELLIVPFIKTYFLKLVHTTA